VGARKVGPTSKPSSDELLTTPSRRSSQNSPSSTLGEYTRPRDARKLLLGMHPGALSDIMLTVDRDDPLVIGGPGRRMPYGRRLAEKEPTNLSG
jgi:hypothetical protein